MRHVGLGVVVVVSICICSSFASAAEPSFKERFGGVKSWDFYYVYQCSSPHKWMDGPISRARVNYEMSQSGKVRLTGDPLNPNELHITGHGKATSASLNKVFVQSTQHFSNYRYDHGSGTPDTRVNITLLLDRGVYTIDVQPGEFPVTYGGTDRAAGNAPRTWGPTDGNQTVHMPSGPGADDQAALKLPETGTIISGSWSFEQMLAGNKRKDDSFKEEEWAKRYPTSGTIKWTLVPADVLDVELIVEPQDYDSWIPQGGKDEATAGNTIAVKATLIGKGGGAPSVKARRINFRLMESSREPGVCLNQPLKEAKTTHDLAFEAAKHEGWTIGEEGMLAATPYGEMETATATVSSYDWGAFGNLLVTAELTNGRIAIGHLKGSDLSDVLLPKRNAQSKIADKWKETFGYKGTDDEDNDKQPGNDHPGDGLTAYEEYRGLLIRGEHSRKGEQIDPLTKDLFIENQLGKVAKSGIAMFRKASGIRVIEMEKGELPESRLVNVNHGRSCGGEQFGLRLINDKPTTGGAGENRPAAKLGKTPKWSDAVVIDVEFAKKNYAEQSAAVKAGGGTLPYTQEEEFDNTVAHEIGHGVHAPHHGPATTNYRGPRALTVRMRDWAAYGTDGVKVDLAKEKNQTFPLLGSIGLPGNEFSGDSGCIMAYTGVYQWAAVGPLGGPYKFYGIGPQPVGKHFCTSPKAAGINLPHKLENGAEIPGFFGDATTVGEGLPAGNCLGQMRVKDW